jgi:putative solute:sodium symporter small subunit
MDENKAQAYWQANVKLIAILLGIWTLVSYIMGIILVPVLREIPVGNLPMGFWFANQGSMFIFIILIYVYATLMDKMDREFGVEE